MAFLAPLFLAGMAVAAVPIVLHLLKRDPEPRVKFAVVRLLRRAPVEHTQRHRLRELLLLALRVAALALLALAFARPFVPSGAALTATGVTMIALDTSYSMNAPGRFERARQLAKDAVGRAPARDLVGVVTFADDASIVAKPSADRVLALAAIDQAAPGFGATRYRAALSASGQSLSGRGAIVIVTDLQEGGWDAGDRAAVPDGTRVEIADVGAPPPNLAVVAVRPLADRVVATLRNTGPRARDVRARLAIDGRSSGEMTATVGSGQLGDVTFAGAPRGDAAAVSIDDPDGLQADNVHYAVIAARARPSVLVVTGSGTLDREAFYVRHALAAGESGERGYAIEGLSGAQLSALAPGDDSRLAPYIAIVLLSTRGLERRGREAIAAYVHGGGGLFLAAGPDVDGDVAGDLLGGGSALRIAAAGAVRQATRTLAPADVRHPIYRPFEGTAATLGLVKFQTAVRIDGTGCQTLARFTTGEAALLECASGDGRAIILASDVEHRWNDFPLHASFVPFLHEVVAYLATGRARTTEYVVAAAPAGVPRTPGIHDVATSGMSRRIAVNVDPREGDPARISAEEFQSAVTRLKSVALAGGRVEARQQEDDQHLWQYALALMAITLATEGFIAARTA